MDSYIRWRELLMLAPDTKAVNGIMGDYVGTLTPVLVALPRECAACLREPLDVQAAAVALLQAELRFEGAAEVRALLHEIAFTFASAAVRITLVHQRPSALAREAAESRAGL